MLAKDCNDGFREFNLGGSTLSSDDLHPTSLVAMASSDNLLVMASTLVAMASNLLVMASNLLAMDCNLQVMASTLVARTFADSETNYDSETKAFRLRNPIQKPKQLIQKPSQAMVAKV